ncbi:hypothetical protein F0562_012394 [Nyssa sinensis]|uniref:Cytochrome b5 heme-binding domain-containing protein n=1 Tax=Nyssa sinensis TaxID=561372 RepID=A0A5J4ZX72_9ASTE|nr:hypothetical protein F0562_012394 [Nyssa sinensis]
MELTSQQLKQYDGTDPSKPIYVALKGRVFDVTTGKSFYGPGGAYAMFAGKDASRALAKMSKNEEDLLLIFWLCLVPGDIAYVEV